MTKISKKQAYPIKEYINVNDYFIGTDSETEDLETVNYSFNNIRDFVLAGISPDTGGVLKISEITYNRDDYSTPEALLNSFEPSYSVLRYHVLFVTIKGVKWILKLQNINVGINEVPISNSDFIYIPISVGDKGDAGEQGIQGVQGEQGLKGDNGVNGIDASNNLQRDASASFILADIDNNYVVQLKNTTDITITIPSASLRDKFNVGFSRLGTGEVTFVGDTGVTIKNPTGYKISRVLDSCYLERDSNTQNYILFGNTKV